MNFVEQLIQSGFIPDTLHKFKPNDNWFGCSTYHPNVCLRKDDMVVSLSLQIHHQDSKIIIMKKGDEVIYHDRTGKVPDEETLSKFI